MAGKVHTLIGGGGGGIWTDAILRILCEAGSTVTATKDGVTKTAVEHPVTDEPSEYFFYIHSNEYGTWTLTATKGQDTTTQTVVVDDNIEYNIELSYFNATLRVFTKNGATVTATNGSRTRTGIATTRPHELPIEYQEVEYLESTGTQYIDTGYVPNQTTKIEIDEQFTSLSSNTSGYNARMGTAKNNTIRFLWVISSTHIEVQVLSGTSISVNIPDGMNRHLLTIDAPNRIVTVNNTTASITNAFASQNYPIILFAASSDAQSEPIKSSAKIYSVKIYENGTLVASLIPCYRKSDNVAGFYETIGNTFLTNAGSGSFKIGNTVSSCDLQIPQSGTWSVTDNLLGAVTENVNISAEQTYTVTIAHTLNLYYEGEEYTSITGGWIQADTSMYMPVGSITRPSSPVLQKNDDNMFISPSSNGTCTIAITNNEINLQAFDVLKIDCISNNADSYFSVYSAKSGSTGEVSKASLTFTSTSVRTIYQLPINTIDSGYVGVMSSYNGRTIRVYKVWLE